MNKKLTSLALTLSLLSLSLLNPLATKAAVQIQEQDLENYYLFQSSAGEYLVNKGIEKSLTYSEVQSSSYSWLSQTYYDYYSKPLDLVCAYKYTSTRNGSYTYAYTTYKNKSHAYWDKANYAHQGACKNDRITDYEIINSSTTDAYSEDFYREKLDEVTRAINNLSLDTLEDLVGTNGALDLENATEIDVYWELTKLANDQSLERLKIGDDTKDEFLKPQTPDKYYLLIKSELEEAYKSKKVLNETKNSFSGTNAGTLIDGMMKKQEDWTLEERISSGTISSLPTLGTGITKIYQEFRQIRELQKQIENKGYLKGCEPSNAITNTLADGTQGRTASEIVNGNKVDTGIPCSIRLFNEYANNKVDQLIEKMFEAAKTYEGEVTQIVGDLKTEVENQNGQINEDDNTVTCKAGAVKVANGCVPIGAEVSGTTEANDWVGTLEFKENTADGNTNKVTIGADGKLTGKVWSEWIGWIDLTGLEIK